MNPEAEVARLSYQMKLHAVALRLVASSVKDLDLQDLLVEIVWSLTAAAETTAPDDENGKIGSEVR